MSIFDDELEACEYCDLDPSYCFNIGYCPYEEDCEDESL